LGIFKLIEHEAHSKLQEKLNKIEELKTIQNKDTVLKPTPEGIQDIATWKIQSREQFNKRRTP